MKPRSVARVLGAVVAAAACGLGALPGCSADPEATAPADFCGTSRATNARCAEPSACDTQLALGCSSLPAALSPSTLVAATDCLESGICGVAACISRSQKGATPTDAHTQLAQDFCRFCAPNLPDCAATFYKRGSKSAGLAVLPYGAEVVKAIDDACTGQQGCQAAFTACAASTVQEKLGAVLDAATADCVVKGFASDQSEAPLGPDGNPSVVTCTPANCTGCCRDDRCEKGDDVTGCGGGARACEICAATSTCTAGVCKEPCGPNTCQGCCAGDTCVTGTTSASCGDKGGACQTCAGGKNVCSNHTCIDASCQATCGGCCSAAGCQAGTAASACGASGEACVDCGVGRTCASGGCLLDRASLWDVYISFAVVPDKDKHGASWDLLGGAPDPYLEVFTSEGPSVHSGQTTSLPDTTFPFWAETPVKGVRASELLANTSVEIWDYDSTNLDDFIGGCKLPLTPAIFDGSLQSTDCPATPSGVPVTVYFRINPHGP